MAAQTEPTQITERERQVLEIIEGLLRELGRERAAQVLSLNSSFERDLGMGSLDLVELLVRCETRFDVQLPEEIAEQAETPAGWVRAIVDGGRAAEEAGRQGYRIEPAREYVPQLPGGDATLLDIFRRHVECVPDRTCVHLLENGSGRGLTYGNLYDTASAVAAGLIASGLQRNDTVAIMLPTGADFFYAFFGTMLAGGIPVPIYPPSNPNLIEEYVKRQMGILRSAEIRFLITFDRVRAVSQLMKMLLPGTVEVTTADALREGRSRSRVAVAPSDVALVQYTSGSTGDPKGVVLTHRGVLANLRGIGNAVDVRPSDSVVSWLPLYSDMGLAGSLLFSFYYGVPLTLLSPIEFLEHPETWLRAIHQARGTLSAAPNFAFELCARKIPAWTLEGLDLSCWRLAVNAGEPVSPETMSRFVERFGPFGFRPESVTTAYGLAESCVALTFPSPGGAPRIDAVRRDSLERKGKAEPAPDGERSCLRFYSLGRPLAGHELRVVDDAKREVGERVRGRLLFRGPSRTPGYFRSPEATASAIDADGWMETGDLAYLAGGELFVTGRTKDCILKAGRNLSPHDVEATACEVPGVEPQGAAAFGEPDPESGTERLIVVAETRATLERDLQRIEAGIVKKISDSLDIRPDVVQLIRRGNLPKTSNGRVRRHETRNLYRQGRLQRRRLYPWIQIARLWRQNLGPVLVGGLERGFALAHRISFSSARFVLGAAAGAAARLLGNPSFTPAAARAMLRLHGLDYAIHGAERVDAAHAVIYIGNRASVLDPVVLTALLPAPIRFADSSALTGLPWPLAFLLQPLIATPPKNKMQPKAAAQEDRIRHALEEGCSVVVFPEGAVGAPAHLSPFRLDAFFAAAGSQCPVQPIALRMEGTEGRVSVGDRILPGSADPSHLTVLRDRVRGAISQLCQ
ncbi:MAG: AMP-binding protein [Bryobacteraceae bacterium]